jgi:hypothetical protein
MSNQLPSYLFFESNKAEVAIGFVIGLVVMSLLFVAFVLAHQE